MPRTITLRRVVVTGLGAVTDVGLDVPTFWKSLLDGTSGIGPITSFPQTNDWSTRFGGEVRGFDPEKHMGVDGREAKRMDRFCLYGLGAAVEAARDCGIDFATGDFERRGVAIGSGIGGIDTIETNHTRLTEGGPRKVSPFVVPRLMVNACAGQASIRFNLQGVNIATATACATGSHAIGAAYHMIQRGDADVMLAGGAEGAIGETQGRHGRVFDFDAGVHAPGVPREDFGREAGEPLEEIDRVNGLVHHRAPAVEGEGDVDVGLLRDAVGGAFTHGASRGCRRARQPVWW